MMEDKISLTHRRAELVESLATPLSTEDRVRVQGELSVVNAKIKAINTTTAAQLKADADRRKVAGLTEFQTNTARAIAKVNGTPVPKPDEDGEDDDPGQTRAIDGWIDAVLLRHDVEFSRTGKGALAISTDTRQPDVVDSLLATLIEGIYAAARGQELPDLPMPSKTQKPKPKKPKKR